MSVRSARVTLPLVLLCACLLGAPGADAVTTPRTCGKIEVRGKSYLVKAHIVGCRKARRWSSRYLRTGARPSGWRCRRYPGSSIPFVCSRAGKDFYAIRR